MKLLRKNKNVDGLQEHTGSKNHIEATLGHLKNRFNLERIKWTIQDGETMQIHLR